MYVQIVCEYRKEKAKPNRIRLTVGRDQMNYPEECCTPTADLLMVKLLLNSVVSTPTEKFMMMDIKNIYLNMPLKQYEYLDCKSSKFITN